MKFRTFIENTTASGEFWITDDGIQEAGGDGNYNHESYVLDMVMHTTGEALGADVDDEHLDWDEVIASAISNYLEELSPQEIDALAKQLNTTPDDLEDQTDELIAIIAKNNNIDNESLAIIAGTGDAREYAMEHWGWKRVVGNDAETWTLTPNDMKMISDGYFEIDESLLPETEINIYIYSTNQSVESTLGNLEQGRLSGSTNTQITPNQAQIAANQNVKNTEINKMNPYYRNKLFPFGDWTLNH